MTILSTPAARPGTFAPMTKTPSAQSASGHGHTSIDRGAGIIQMLRSVAVALGALTGPRYKGSRQEESRLHAHCP